MNQPANHDENRLGGSFVLPRTAMTVHRMGYLRAWGDNGQAPGEEPLTEPLSVLAELKQEGLIRHLGLSNVTSKQLGATPMQVALA